MRRTWITAVAATLGAATPLLAQDVVREGAGSRREQLDKMELKDFPAAAWDALSDWRGEPAELTAGNVTLLVTFASWYQPSMTGLVVAQRLADELGDQGLTVVGVHDPRGYEDVAAQLERRKITIPVALDAEGKFRKTLMADQDPDFYVIDRAGRLRYADIATTSVDRAVRELIAESRSDAQDLPQRLADERAAAAAAARRTGAINTDVDLADLPEFTIPQLGEEAYSAADWPARWSEFEEQALRNRGRRDEAVETILAVSPDMTTFGKPLSTNGRATVVYFWLPEVIASYDRVQPQMDLLAREKSRDVAVIGVLMPPLQNERRRDEDAQAEAERARKFEQQVRRARTERRYDHTIVVDPAGSILTQVVGGDGGGVQQFPLPMVAIFSTDNKLRWIGTPHNSRFDAALERILRVDPGVQMRRDLERAYIRERGG
ncbi:MAG: peroxiredoxin family protein [Phycisphaerales bacterium JB039]